MLDGLTWENTLRTAWSQVRDRVEIQQDLEFSHEHTLQFHFAWELARLVGFSESLGVRFEIYCGKDAHNETIRLDLLVWTDPTFKIAVEMKAPIRSGSGSNSAMTMFRMGFYRDLDHLTYLVEKRRDGIQRGMFIAVVNERGYVVHGRQRVNEVYKTYHGTTLGADTRIPACPGPNGCQYELVMPCNPVSWQWSVDEQRNPIVPVNGMRHFWLDPISIYRRAATNRTIGCRG